MQILRFVSGLTALLGQKAPHTAAPCITSQLDWDNHTIGTEDAKWWTEAVAVATIGDVCGCGQTMETGAAVCSTCLEESEFLIPSVCKGCGKVDNKVVSDFCRDCEVNGTEWKLRGGDSKVANTETNMNNDLDGIDDLLRECPCAGTGGICKSCLAFNNAHSE